MPSVSSAGGALVLVTGANGYIATWVVQGLLEKGYTVRGAVRSAEKGKRLTEYFDSTPYGSKLEVVVVEDISKPGAFDEAVKGVDAIEHVASPTAFSRRPDDHPDVLIVPAVEGTLGVLRSALNFGTKVKRIVITSSITAILPIFSAAESGVTVPVDETHWADGYVREVKEQGNKAGVFAKYCASKTLAERAAWEFYEKHKSEVFWDLVAINPATVLGAPLLDSPDGSVTSSLQWWYDNACKEQPDAVLRDTFGFIDVQDVVAAHVAALRQDAAGGQRIIVCNRTTTWQQHRNEMYALRPHLYTSGVLPRGNTALTTAPVRYAYNTTKATHILGVAYTDAKDTLGGTLDYFAARDGYLGSGSESER